MLKNARRKLNEEDEMQPEALPGMFRVFQMERLGPDWRTAINAESVMLIVQRTLDRELADRPLIKDRALISKIRMMAKFAATMQLAPANRDPDDSLRNMK